MSDKIKKTRTLPVEVEYMKYTNLSDVRDFARYFEVRD